MPHAHPLPPVETPGIEPRRPGRTALVYLLLAPSVPVVPRLWQALTGGQLGADLSAWGRAWGARWVENPGREVLAWLWMSLPVAAFALGAWLLLRRERNGPNYPGLQRTLAMLSVPLFVWGWMLCAPTGGQGFDFYWGEVVFPILTTPVVVVVLLILWGSLVWRSRRSSDPPSPGTRAADLD